MKRKFCTLILAIAFLFVTAIPAFAGEFGADDVGDEFKVDIMLGANPGVADLLVVLSFDPDVVELLNSATKATTWGTIIPGGTQVFNEASYVLIWTTADGNNITGTGTLVTLDFKVKAAGDPGFDLDITATNAAFADVPQAGLNTDVVLVELAPPPPPPEVCPDCGKYPCECEEETPPPPPSTWTQPAGGFDPGDGIPAAPDTPDAPDTPVVPPVVVPPSGNEGSGDGAGDGSGGGGAQEPDENVKAGVALAIVPALVAAAAVAITRKRK